MCHGQSYIDNMIVRQWSLGKLARLGLLRLNPPRTRAVDRGTCYLFFFCFFGAGHLCHCRQIANWFPLRLGAPVISLCILGLASVTRCPSAIVHFGCCLAEDARYGSILFRFIVFLCFFVFMPK
uniref:Uncharacterized protein n=1 Tax=Trypanosoma vivax (strain Y486) TaxID=1055687 RepID=G0U305_TRYVY|nr:hypothetical protein TVY486_0904810 [Trypanosoma vivax Y486]